jgi:hypothetical protein
MRGEFAAAIPRALKQITLEMSRHGAMVDLCWLWSNGDACLQGQAMAVTRKHRADLAPCWDVAEDLLQNGDRRVIPTAMRRQE